MNFLSPGEIFSKLKTSAAGAIVERRERREIGLLRDQLRQAVFQAGFEQDMAVRFFNDSLRAAAAAGRTQQGDKAFAAEKDYLRNAIAEARNQSAGAAAISNNAKTSGAPVAHLAAPAVLQSAIPPVHTATAVAQSPLLSTRPAVALPQQSAPKPSATKPVAAAPVFGLARIQSSILSQLDRSPAARIASAPASRTAAAAAEASSAPAANQPTLQQLHMIADKVFDGTSEVADRNNFTVMFAAIEKRAFQAHLKIPGMRADSELAAQFYRIEPERVRGMLRAEQLSRQSKINAILKGKMPR